MNANAADIATQREVARLGNLFPVPWVVSYRICCGLVVYVARRPGLELCEASAQALENEINGWERA